MASGQAFEGPDCIPFYWEGNFQYSPPHSPTVRLPPCIHSVRPSLDTASVTDTETNTLAPPPTTITKKERPAARTRSLAALTELGNGQVVRGEPEDEDGRDGADAHQVPPAPQRLSSLSRRLAARHRSRRVQSRHFLCFIAVKRRCLSMCVCVHERDTVCLARAVRARRRHVSAIVILSPLASTSSTCSRAMAQEMEARKKEKHHAG